MSNVIQFAPLAAQNSRKGIIAKPSIDLVAALEVSRTICLRPGPVETPSQFVTRIVRAYKEEAGE